MGRQDFIQGASVFLFPSDATPPVELPRSASALCVHCGAPAPTGVAYCCKGCEAAAKLLSDDGLMDFYSLRNGPGRVGAMVDKDECLPPWLERELEAPKSASDVATLQSLTCHITGIHCAACSWVIPELAKRAGAIATEVNAGKGVITFRFAHGSLDALSLLRHLQTLGYELFPLGESRPGHAQSMLLRTGLTVALALNTMLLSLSRYFGLSDVDGAMFIAVEAVLMVLAVAIGGSYFLRRAWVALRHRTLSLDVPVALGIAFGAAGSIAAYVLAANAAYFDTVTLFIAIMLVGRTFQAFTAERAQAQVRAPTSDHQWLVRRQRPTGGVEIVSASVLARGDTIEVGPNDLVILGAKTTEATLVSNEWLTGEPEPVAVECGASLDLGTKYRGRQTTALVVTEEFDAQKIADLLAPNVEGDRVQPTDWLGTVSALYPPAVLSLALAGFALWFRSSPATAFEVMVSLLVITCPCALGLAIPLAYELAAASARKLGVIVCRQSVFDRLPSVDTIVFDKTGTATLGELRVKDGARLQSLSPDDKRALCALARNSSHPRSQAVSAALDAISTPTDTEQFCEQVGGGVEASIDGRWVRFGSAAYCQQDDVTDGASVFASASAQRGPYKRIATVRFSECERPNTKEELTTLAKMGVDVRLLSGDASARVEEFARTVGLAPESAVGEKTPSQKRAAILALKDAGHVVAMVGDGLNDSAALDAADVRAVPGLTVPGAARACDIASVSPDLLPMAGLLALSRRLRWVVRANAAFAVVYNLTAAALALSGVVTPLFAAIWMPAGSIAVVVFTTLAMRNVEGGGAVPITQSEAGRNRTASWAKPPGVDVHLLQTPRSAP